MKANPTHTDPFLGDAPTDRSDWEQVVEMNEALILGAVRQHELTEEAENLNVQLRAQRMESLGTLAGGIAHDLNNSLGPILMSLELLRRKLPDSDSHELFAILETSARRGADRVRQILFFARGAEVLRAEVEVAQLVREVEKSVSKTFLRHSQIRTRIPPEAGIVLGDFALLHQVLLNLCLNAQDAMPDGGLLEISADYRDVAATDDRLRQNPTAAAGTYVILEVKDSGTGMAPGILEKIFDPFFTTKEFGKGAGLGLSTSLGIVRSHGGFFHVASELGKGTTFQIYLPAQPHPAAPAPAPPPPEMTGGSGQLILVVDDEEPMRWVTREILEMFGYRVVLACDGAEAVAIYMQRGAEISGVITDMTMPVMDGPEAIRLLRGINPKLPIIGTSGLALTTYAPHLASLGVKHILSKPYTTSELLNLLKEALG